MNIKFYKYQGTGNDFVMIDNLSGEFDSITLSQIQLLCDRKFGIGADGLIFLKKSLSTDFEMDYFNADGSKSFCGNGARCSVRFARDLGIIDNKTTFEAIDGVHTATIDENQVVLDMSPVSSVEEINGDYFINTGSPHYMRIEEVKKEDIISFGKEIRYSEKYRTAGTNVNLIYKTAKNKIDVQTYERGVEDETLSCGTGVTACALLVQYIDKTNDPIEITTKGGVLKVSSSGFNGRGFEDIKLEGPTTFVFEGEINV